MKAWQHFKTITRHKWLVFQGCARVGLYWQGITDDLSKYSPTEFSIGIRYFQGTRSPNAAEREEIFIGVYPKHTGTLAHTSFFVFLLLKGFISTLAYTL